MTDTDTSVMQERIGQLCHQFKLPTMGAQSVDRFTAAGHGDALPTLLEVLEQEADDRRHRRINRLRQSSKLPSGKTWETFEHHRMPLALRQQLDHLAQGSSVERGVNVPGLRTARRRQDPRPLCPGPPPGGSRPLRPLRTGLLSGAGTPRRQTRPGPAPPAARTGQLRLPAPGRPGLPAPGRPVDRTEESEVLFTLIAERYERRSLGITSNLVCSEWERIFATPWPPPRQSTGWCITP